MEILQEQVEKYCKDNKVLKKDFARKIGVTQTNFSHWLKGKTSYGRKKLEIIMYCLENGFNEQCKNKQK